MFMPIDLDNTPSTDAISKAAEDAFMDAWRNHKTSAETWRHIAESVLATALTEAMEGRIKLDGTEPYFILRGKDRLACECVDFWVKLAEKSNVPDHKIESARKILEEMRLWPEKKYPD